MVRSVRVTLTRLYFMCMMCIVDTSTYNPYNKSYFYPSAPSFGHQLGLRKNRIQKECLVVLCLLTLNQFKLSNKFIFSKEICKISKSLPRFYRKELIIQEAVEYLNKTVNHVRNESQTQNPAKIYSQLVQRINLVKMIQTNIIPRANLYPNIS